MPRKITKAKIASKKRVVKKSKKVQLKVRVAQKIEVKSQKLEETQIKSKKGAVAAKEKIIEKINILPALGQATKEKIIEKKEIAKKIKQPKKKTKKQPQDVKQSDPEKIERDKRLMMWAGVTFFMVLIFGVWIFNIKNVFKTIENTDTNSSAVQEWDKIADEFSATLEKVKEGMAELKEVETEEDGRDVFSESATTTDDAIVSEDDKIEELKKRLEELESKVGGEQATSTN